MRARTLLPYPTRRTVALQAKLKLSSEGSAYFTIDTRDVTVTPFATGAGTRQTGALQLDLPAQVGPTFTADLSPVPMLASPSASTEAGLAIASTNAVLIQHQAQGNTAEHASSLTVVAAGGSLASGNGTDGSDGAEGRSGSTVAITAKAIDCLRPVAPAAGAAAPPSVPQNPSPTAEELNALADVDPAPTTLPPLPPPPPPVSMLQADAALVETHSAVATIAGNLSTTLLQSGRLTSEPGQAMRLNAVGAGLEARAFLDATVKAHLGGVQITAAAAGARTRLVASGGGGAGGDADAGVKGAIEIASEVKLNLDNLKAAPSLATGEHLGLAACACADGSVFVVPGDSNCEEWVANHPSDFETVCV